jgi:hypothetical protein
MHVPRSPQNTAIYKIVRENYRQVFFDKEQLEIHLPFHLEREFKKYLNCGILAKGMARFHCSLCQKDKFVAYSCKGRTLCPSCTGRRIADTAKHLVEEVIPEVPMRQWVLSMPYTHRFLMATNTVFLRKSLQVFHRTINSFYIRKARGHKDAKVGAITVVQRFGGALNLNVHFHSLYTDGVFFENELGDEIFYEIIPTHEEIIQLTNVLKQRLSRLIKKIDLQPKEYSIEAIQAQSVQNRDENFLPPTQIGKISNPPFQEFTQYRSAYDDGFSLHANVKILGNQKDALERLCRYVMRGPLSQERVTYEAGRVQLKLKSPYLDGTTHLQFTAEQFIKRMIALIPPPRQNLIRYVGVFGARHKKRQIITSKAKPKDKKEKSGKKKIYRTPWAELLKHVFKYEANFCDHCGNKLELVACITSTYACEKILRHLGVEVYTESANSPRAPPELDLFDQDNLDF